MRLLRGYLRDGTYRTPKGAQFFEPSGKQETLFEAIERGEVDTYVKVMDLTVDWNSRLLDGIADDTGIEKNGVSAPVGDVHFKTHGHMMAAIRSYAEIVRVSLLKRGDPELGPKLSISDAPMSDSRSSIRVTVPETRSTEMSKISVTTAVLPNVAAELLNQEPRAPPPKRTTSSLSAAPKKAKTGSTEAAAVDDPQEARKKNSKATCPCPGCGLKSQFDLACPFALWCHQQLQLPKDDPTRFKRILSENEKPALRRTWIGRFSAGVPPPPAPGAI